MVRLLKRRHTVTGYGLDLIWDLKKKIKYQLDNVLKHFHDKYYIMKIINYQQNTQKYFYTPFLKQ